MRRSCSAGGERSGRGRPRHPRSSGRLRVNARTDAIHYVGHAAPTPLLFQFARHERYFDEAAMSRYATAASEPKLVKWYHAGHELNDVRALLDRAEWLREHIGLGSLAPILRREVGRR